MSTTATIIDPQAKQRSRTRIVLIAIGLIIYLFFVRTRAPGNWPPLCSTWAPDGCSAPARCDPARVGKPYAMALISQG